MIITHILILIYGALLGIAKAAAERTVDFFHWNNSIFAINYPFNITVDRLRGEVADGTYPSQFTHPREISWIRKDRAKNKFLNKLYHTVLVGTTDLWHFADTITALIAFIAIPATIILAPELSLLHYAALLVGTWMTYAISFHLFFLKFLYLSQKTREVSQTNK